MTSSLSVAYRKEPSNGAITRSISPRTSISTVSSAGCACCDGDGCDCGCVGARSGVSRKRRPLIFSRRYSSPTCSPTDRTSFTAPNCSAPFFASSMLAASAAYFPANSIFFAIVSHSVPISCSMMLCRSSTSRSLSAGCRIAASSSSARRRLSGVSKVWASFTLYSGSTTTERLLKTAERERIAR